MKPELLHVVCAVSNPMRWKSRINRYLAFRDHMIASGVHLTVVECGYGDRPWEVESIPGINVVRVRSNSWVWVKENLLNIGVARLPDDWKYVCFADADIHFKQQYWAAETVQALQVHPVVMPWTDCYDLGPNGEHVDSHKSFAWMNWHRKVVGIGKGYEFAHPGYAWAWRRDALDKAGGLLESGVAGAGDHHMALALIGKADWSFPGGISQEYKNAVLLWQSRVRQHNLGDIGFVQGTIEHNWHGSKESRGYISRWDILVKNNINPIVDLKRNIWGVQELAGNKPELGHDLERYMYSRKEDSNSM